MFTYLTPTERIWLSWYGPPRVCGYTETAADLYTRLTGRQHPRARGEAS